MKPVLYTFVGIPGSGKTEFALHFSKKMNAVHLSSDHIRKKMFGGNPDKFERSVGNPMVFGALGYVTHEILSAGYSVVHDSNHNFQHVREETRNLAEKSGADLVLIWMKVPLDIAIKRATSRDEDDYRRKTTKNKVIAHSERLEEPLKEPHILINGEQSFEQQFADFEAQLNNL